MKGGLSLTVIALALAVTSAAQADLAAPNNPGSTAECNAWADDARAQYNSLVAQVQQCWQQSNRISPISSAIQYQNTVCTPMDQRANQFENQIESQRSQCVSIALANEQRRQQELAVAQAQEQQRQAQVAAARTQMEEAQQRNAGMRKAGAGADGYQLGAGAVAATASQRTEAAGGLSLLNNNAQDLMAMYMSAKALGGDPSASNPDFDAISSRAKAGLGANPFSNPVGSAFAQQSATVTSQIASNALGKFDDAFSGAADSGVQSSAGNGNAYVQPAPFRPIAATDPNPFETNSAGASITDSAGANPFQQAPEASEPSQNGNMQVAAANPDSPTASMSTDGGNATSVDGLSANPFVTETPPKTCKTAHDARAKKCRNAKGGSAN
jgi:hypothetical protein